MRGRGHFCMWPLFSWYYTHLRRQKHTASLSELKQTHSHAHIQRCMCCGWAGTSMRAMQCVRGIFEVWLYSDVDEWSVKTMSHSCPAPLYSGERQGVCVCGKGGVTEVIFACAFVGMWPSPAMNSRCWVCVILSTFSHTCERRGRGITRVSGLGSECEWNGRKREVKHSDPCATLGGIPLF